MIRAARKLTKEKGILELPAAKKGKTLSEDGTQSVLAFYEVDEYTRLMPGKRNCVSLGKKEYRQKRLLLCNLNELHAAYKQKHPAHKIGLSKFCSLGPKWCVTVSSSGTHSVCGCTIHQNTKLLVEAFSGNISGCMRRINWAAAGDAEVRKLKKLRSLKLPTGT